MNSDSNSEELEKPADDPELTGSAVVEAGGSTPDRPVVAGTALTEDDVSTSLPWPKTWNGAYLFVIGTFVLWLTLLLALKEFCK